MNLDASMIPLQLEAVERRMLLNENRKALKALLIEIGRRRRRRSYQRRFIPKAI